MVRRTPSRSQRRAEVTRKVGEALSQARLLRAQAGMGGMQDKAAWAAITYAGYPPLPKEFKGKYLELRFAFLYNIRPGEE